MARSKIASNGVDLTTDSGAVLFSFVQGEQLEYPISLNFLTSPVGFVFEAVIVEALNEVGQLNPPQAIKPGGVQHVLNVRVPQHRGNWDAPQAYNSGESVNYGSLVYRLKNGAARVSSVTPDVDEMWELSSTNIVYIQFNEGISHTWEIQPAVHFHTYGFFELRVTEPMGSFRKTWKPVRGMVEIQFSPTKLVPE